MRRLISLVFFTLVTLMAVIVIAVLVLGRDAVEDGLREIAWGPREVTPSLPPAPPGSPLLISLSDSPRSVYGPKGPTAEDAKYAAFAKAAGRTYEPSLAAAARELAMFYADHRRLATSSALGFLLESAGATYWGVRQSVIITNASGDGPLKTFLAESFFEGEVLGIGEGVLPDAPPQRLIVALAATPTMTLDPLPRTFTPGESITISGVLGAGYTEPKALVMGPSGDFTQLEIATEGRRFTASMPGEEGEWVVEILALGPHGPVPLTQVTLYGGVSVPTVYESTWPPAFAKVTDGARYVAKLVNAARREAGVPTLVLNDELSSVALGHSKDMAMTDFVGHHSPTTGTLSHRLRDIQYRSVSRGENVALNGSLYDAHMGLMRSLGHRKNILSRQFTHMGIGVRHAEKGWYVTEVFTLPTPVIGERASAKRLFRQIQSARAEDDLESSGGRDTTLDRIARRASRGVLESPRAIVEAVRQAGIKSKATVWTARLSTLEQFEMPNSMVDAEVSRFGVGVYQNLDREGPSISVVLIAAGP